MRGRIRRVVSSAMYRLRRIERREVAEFRDWIEHTGNLIHVSILVFLPLLIGLVTFISNALDTVLPFLLFPPLASGSYTLFANPESNYASPRRFVGGLTAGALCGWIALELSSRFWYAAPAGSLEAHAGAAAFGVFLTGSVTWLLDIEEASAFSTALLVLVTGTTQLLYVVSVAVSTTIVAIVFIVWRDRFYERRATFLYQTTQGDDHVLVPMLGEHPHSTAMMGAYLAAAHEAGKVVLLDLVDRETLAEVERSLLAANGITTGGTDDRPQSEVRGGEADPLPATTDGSGTDNSSTVALSDLDEAAQIAVASSTTALENRAAAINERFDIPCEVIVAVGGGDPAATVLDAAGESTCDLIVTPYDSADGRLSGFIRGLFAGEFDVLVHRSVDERTEWQNALVPVRRAGDVAHAMLDFALRLVDGEVSVCHCIETERERRNAETLLANLVETFSGDIETRVARTPIEVFLERTDDRYDLIFLGASTDRSAASRLLSRPTFQRVGTLDTDIAIVHRG